MHGSIISSNLIWGEEAALKLLSGSLLPCLHSLVPENQMHPGLPKYQFYLARKPKNHMLSLASISRKQTGKKCFHPICYFVYFPTTFKIRWKKKGCCLPLDASPSPNKSHIYGGDYLVKATLTSAVVWVVKLSYDCSPSLQLPPLGLAHSWGSSTSLTLYILNLTPSVSSLAGREGPYFILQIIT